MTRSEWFAGFATIMFAIIAGAISFDYVNRRYQDVSTVRPAENATAEQASPSPVTVPGACVDGDGAWKNWSYSNVPMLSPKCETK